MFYRNKVTHSHTPVQRRGNQARNRKNWTIIYQRDQKN